MIDLATLLKIADSSLAVFAVLFIGWRVEIAFRAITDRQTHIIEVLINLCADDDRPE